jgi:dTDP-L-rhamnose 4-epimerase
MPGPILVTGGAGFIGSHVVDALVAAGRETRVLDHLHPAAHARTPSYMSRAAEWIRGDLRDPDAARRAVDGVSAVCHQAAMVGLGVDPRDVVDYVAHNDLGTAVLLRALAAAGFRGRVVLASSMVIYGEGRYRCARHGTLPAAPRAVTDLDAGRFDPPCPACGAPLEPEVVPEDAPADPRSLYAATKLHQEHLCACFAREVDGVTVTALRYHNVYGPRMPRDTPYAGVAALFRSALAAGRAPRVFEDGRQLRDFVHVRDVARANLLALCGERAVPGAFNVASGRPASIGEMAQALAAACGDGALAPVVTGEYRRGDVRHVFASTARAEATLGFRADVGLQDGMRDFAGAELRAPVVADEANHGAAARTVAGG